MSRLEWNNDLSVGVEEIDNQHKELIRIANGLINAVDKGRNERVVKNVVRRLREYTVFHFNSEEKLMERVHYPKRGEHEKEHTRLKNNVKRYQRRLYQRQTLRADDVLNFLKIWLLKHILEVDMELAHFIHDQKPK